MSTTEFTVGYTWKAPSMDGFYVSQTSVQDTDQLVVVIKLANEAEAKKFAAAPRLLEKLEDLTKMLLSWHDQFPEEVGDKEKAILAEADSLLNEVKGPTT